MSRPSHPLWFNQPNNIRWRIQSVKFIIMQFSSRSVFLPFSFKYLPQHSILKNPQSMFLPHCQRPRLRPIQYNWQNYSFVYFNLKVLSIWDGKTKDFGLKDSKNSLNLIYSLFDHECHSDLLVSSPSIWILPHFQTIHWLSLYSGSDLNLDDET
jgi:hypothetical protein